jgi:hypothetical protein
MRVRIAALLTLSLFAAAASMRAQEAAPRPQPRQQPAGPVQGDRFQTQYIRLSQQGEGLLYMPKTPSPKSRIALTFTHPGGNNFMAPIGRELASRGYIVMNVNYRGDVDAGVDAQLTTVSAAVAYLRSLPGVQKVIVSGHSGGAHEMALYENVAEHGASACSGPEKVYPCKAAGLDGLQKPDGLLLLDPPLGAFHGMSSIDPAVDKDVNVRNPALDMFAAANGFDAAAKRAHYPAEFARRFYAAQSKRNNEVLAHVLERLRAVEQGKGRYSNDEPLEVPGLGEDANGARLYQTDPAFAAHTRAPHLLLKADGTRAEQIIQSVRSPASQAAGQLRTLGVTSTSSTLRTYLAHAAIRTTADFAITADDITGVDWRSAYDSAPGNAYGISAPTLVLAMGCHYLMVPGELIYDRLASKDKTYAAVEGATHGFSPCKPEYGDTVKRTFDFVDEWLSRDGRF